MDKGTTSKLQHCDVWSIWSSVNTVRMNLRTQKIEKCLSLRIYDDNNSKFIERFQSRNLKLFKKNTQHINTRTQINGINMH